MSMKTFVLPDRWLASLRDVLTKGKLPVLMIASATLPLTGNQTMSQPNCDAVKIAEDYVRTHLSFANINISRRVLSVVSLADGADRQVTFNLPDGSLGFVPEITVDKRTCQVVSAVLWQ